MTQTISRRQLLAGSAAAVGLLAASPVRAAPGPAPVPFRIDVPQAKLDQIRTRLQTAVWPDIPQGEPWEFGASPEALKDLLDYWFTRYDWRAQEAAMNALPQFKAQVDGYDIHFIHVKGSGRRPQPILLSHGWPGSFVEFLKVIDPLTHPEKHGGKAEDAFSVVVPSLPGFGFSSKPPRPIGTRRIGRLFDKLMVQTLGYDGYIAQGGDYGSSISQAIGHDSPNCKAIHINLLLGVGVPPASEEERKAAEFWPQHMRREGGYIAIQSSKPLTLSYAMADSPLGQVAWIFEKFRTWAQLPGGDPWAVFTRDEVINNLMVYLVTDTFGTASWMYRSEPDPYPPMKPRLDKPVGVAHFPGEIAMWPRSYGERIFNLVRWSEPAKGGHFAAMEQPALFVDEIRAFRRQLKA